MSGFEHEISNDQLAREKGLKRTCEHGVEYDPHLGKKPCPKCQKKEEERRQKYLHAAKEREEQAKQQAEKEKQLKNAFDLIIWPDNEPPKMS